MPAIKLSGGACVTKPAKQLAFFLALLFGSALQPLRAQTWELAPDPLSGCTAFACSADGRIFYALVGDNDALYVSTNGGTSWAYLLRDAGTPLSCSGNGTKVATGIYPWVSTNFGASFTEGPGYGYPIWPADGNLLIATGDGVTITTNGGATWITAPLTAGGLQHAAVSSNGSVIVTANEGSIHISTDSGQSWSTADTGTNTGWASIACTADGKNIIASGYSGVEISRNSGTTWSQPAQNIPDTFPDTFFTIHSSDDGSLLVANNDHVYISRDFGVSWVLDDTAAYPNPGAVTCSADGTLLLSDSYGYVVTQKLPPPLNIVPSANQLTLSWPAPSSQYTLQQASDLSSTNWLGVTNAITVTNYRNQATLAPPATGAAFYRLQGPNP